MILAGINPSAQSITLFSIPRDLWVEYPESQQSGKINAIYDNSLYL
jgi:anionic cell wall polymer biosynthesis LytR-Cps2A-Psr (LCP) family protein